MLAVFHDAGLLVSVDQVKPPSVEKSTNSRVFDACRAIHEKRRVGLVTLLVSKNPFSIIDVLLGFRLFAVEYVEVEPFQFGLSVNQASSDLSRYIGLAPNNMDYDRSLRTYVRQPGFKPVFDKQDVQSIGAVAQGRQRKVDHVETEIKVGAEMAFFHEQAEILVAR